MRVPHVALVLVTLATLLAAGCLQGSLPDSNAVTRGDLHLSLSGDRVRFPPGTNATFELRVTNVGNATVSFRQGCGNPWDHQVLRNGNPVATHPPMYRCQAFQEAHLAPGASITTVLAWNGTTWSGGSYHDAAGTYVLRGVFEHEDPAGGPLRSEHVDLTLDVGS